MGSGSDGVQSVGVQSVGFGSNGTDRVVWVRWDSVRWGQIGWCGLQVWWDCWVGLSEDGGWGEVVLVQMRWGADGVR